jgi:hypothetical protein
MSNRLARETSPYLQQHQDNPVDWFPWGEEALARAKAENKPILLSIGYSACHWCHVMAHESFENPEIARLMNERFINIKVDREERPDLDQIYQNVAQAITQSGGWPLTVFLTPELKPYFGGTYYPPEDRWGRPGFPRVLTALSDAYANDPASVTENADKLTDFIRELESGSVGPSAGNAPSLAMLEQAAEKLVSQVDWEDGGIGGAPKFPNSMMLDFLWRFGLATQNDAAMEATRLTLSKMASGGIYDQLGGGFHRYSVDATWSVPHFEKMLYDNGLLLKTYSQVLLTSPLDAAGSPSAGMLNDEQRDLFARTIDETVAYVLREMRASDGAFFAAQDADSEGEEGKFFVWDLEDLKKHLTEDEARVFGEVYGVREGGNFEHGKTVLYLADPSVFKDRAKSEILMRARRKLFEVRKKRVAPGTDDKVLASWNGLMISGLAWASQALKRQGALQSSQEAWAAANRAFDFLEGALKSPLGAERLQSTWKSGQARLNAYLDDYAFLAMAAIDLSRFEPDAKRMDNLLSKAEGWLSTILTHFSAESGAGYYFTSDDHEALIQRPRTLYDQAIPSGTGVAIHALLALAEIDRTGQRQKWQGEAERQLALIAPVFERSPYGHGELLSAALMYQTGPFVISGPDSESHVFHPFVFRKPGDVLQLCHRQTCELIRRGAREIEALIREKVRQRI